MLKNTELVDRSQVVMEKPFGMEGHRSCKKEDGDRLWQRFNGARNCEKHFEKLKADEAKAAQTKRSLVREAQSPSRASDLRSARQSMRVSDRG
jgi:hypothetical protein